MGEDSFKYNFFINRIYISNIEVNLVAQAKTTPKSSQLRLNAKSSMKPTDNFPEFNLVFNFSHFIQKYKIIDFFSMYSFQ